MICLVELRGLEPLTPCLQSTFTLSVAVVGLGLGFFPVCPSRPLSGLVVVRRGGQALHDLPLRRSTDVLGSAAAFLVRAGSSWSGYRRMPMVSAPFWHAAVTLRGHRVGPHVRTTVLEGLSCSPG